MLNNLPQVTKNILILNLIFFVATFVLEAQGIDLISSFGAHYVNSPLFQPFHIVTHFFMHAGFIHIFFNMWLFLMLGAYLENIWGPKRFFIFYISSALGSFALYNIIGVYELSQLRQQLAGTISIDQLDSILKSASMNSLNEIRNEIILENNLMDTKALDQYIVKCVTPMVGASGAIFGVLTAFAILFPNTEFRIYFLIPVKAKYFVGFYLLWEIYQAYQNNINDSTAHLAHIGGAIVGALIVLFWRKADRTNFW
ncbi:MAG: rhomboid family intramembrane serine protease [Flavobacteriia bacterium]|nr:rhomboid family intramembrane serine protease [Flavobacteriia bacterium]